MQDYYDNYLGGNQISAQTFNQLALWKKNKLYLIMVDFFILYQN
jgi:hypothetical protein